MEITSPMQGTIVSVGVEVGEIVRKGQPFVVIESMKMEHPVDAEEAGEVLAVEVEVGQTVQKGDLLVRVGEGDVVHDDADEDELAVDLEAVRPDLAAVLDRHAV